MRLSPLPLRLPSASAAAAAVAFSLLAALVVGTPLDDLDEALLRDILEAYSGRPASACDSAATAPSTSFSFDWPGANPDSDWFADFVPFEESNFQAIMSHDDAVGDRSWSIRIGTSGNVYSHSFPDRHGETIPPQRHDNAPWIDEVLQSVSVNSDLNKNPDYAQYCPGPDVNDADQCKSYFIHQAGAYQRDAPYTDVPFYSPSLARHCGGNSCTFASWGTSAHVATPFTSPVIYVNRYTNCGDGIIEHTQIIHNFADPSDPLSTPINTDQRYFNVPWGAVRSSALPFALEPDANTGELSYTDVNDVDYLPLCKWGDGDHDAPGSAAGRGARKDLQRTGGYTSFVAGGLLVNRTLPPILPWCRNNLDPNGPNCADAATCMVSSCTDAQVASGSHTRVKLFVPADSSPGCTKHVIWNGLVSLKCNMRDLGFGQSRPFLSSADPCAPWTNVGFYNSRTGEGVDVAFVRHWSYSPNNRLVYFAVFETDEQAAKDLVNGIFENRAALTGFNEPLPIEIRPTSNINSVPPGYDPSSLDAFTYVYGKGEEYVNNDVAGSSRRRLGSTQQGPHVKDFTVFTVNWRGARLKPGETYINRAYMFGSDLGSVETTAGNLVNETIADEIGQEQWSHRAVDVYRRGDAFAVVAAASSSSSAPGDAPTSCGSFASPVCSGTSAPRPGRVPFFYVSCGTSTYLGPDPYRFAPAFGSGFPGHGDIDNPVRSYLCDGQEMSIRPTWKMMGFFNASDAGCAALEATADITYDETVCETTLPPSKAPSSSPSKAASSSPSKAPSSSPSKAPSLSPSSSPSKTPAMRPSKSPTLSPSNVPTNQPSKSPTDAPSSSPSKTPTSQPSKSPTSSPSKGPTNQPSDSPTGAPSSSPSLTPTSAPSKGPTSTPNMAPTNQPTENPTQNPTKQPTPSPTNDPTSNPTNTTPNPTTKQPTPNPTNDPTKQPTPNPTNDPTKQPTPNPTSKPTNATPNPTNDPTKQPTPNPTNNPTKQSTPNPTINPTNQPTPNPTKDPTATPFVELTTPPLYGSAHLLRAAYFDVTGGDVWSKITDLQITSYYTTRLQVYSKSGSAKPYEATPCAWKLVAETAPGWNGGSYTKQYPQWNDDGFEPVILPSNEKVSFYVVALDVGASYAGILGKPNRGSGKYSQWIATPVTSAVGLVTMSHGRIGYSDSPFKPYSNYYSYGIWGGIKLENVETDTSAPTMAPTRLYLSGDLESPMKEVSADTFNGLQFDVENLGSKPVIVNSFSARFAPMGYHHMEVWMREGSHVGSSSGCDNWNNWCDEWTKLADTSVQTAGSGYFTSLGQLTTVGIIDPGSTAAFAIVSGKGLSLTKDGALSDSVQNDELRINLATPIDDYHGEGIQSVHPIDGLTKKVFQGIIHYEVANSLCAIQSMADWVDLDPRSSLTSGAGPQTDGIGDIGKPVIVTMPDGRDEEDMQ